MANPLVRPLKKRILVDLHDRGEKVVKRIIIIDDDFSARGVKPRWATVLAVGADADDEGIAVGQEVLLPHGDWTRKYRVPMSDGSVRDGWFSDLDRVLLVR